jgi:hypothetical protein
MDKENVAYINNGILFRYEEYVVCRKMYGTRDHHVKQISQTEKDKYCMFFSYAESMLFKMTWK